MLLPASPPPEPVPQSDDKGNRLVESWIPYQIITRPVPPAARKTNGSGSVSKKRKRDDREWSNPSLMKSAYDSALDVEYKIKPLSDENGAYWAWTDMPSCRHFEFADRALFSVGDVIYVQGTGDTRVRTLTDDSAPYDDCWVGHVCEVRAVDSMAVKDGPDGKLVPAKSPAFLLVNWLYRPENLPRRPKLEFADGEVFPSNHLDIIEAATVMDKVGSLRRLDEASYASMAGGYEELCWRLPYEVFKGNLAKGRPICVCDKPADPDFGPLLCNNPSGCGLWMHDECAREDVLERLYRRYVLGENPKEIIRQEDEAGGDGERSAKKQKLSTGKAKQLSSKASQQIIKSSHEYFKVDLEAPSKPDKHFLAKVKVLKDPGPASGTRLKEHFDYPVRCLKCRKVLRQQEKHRLLQPQARPPMPSEDRARDSSHVADGTSDAQTSSG